MWEWQKSKFGDFYFSVWVEGLHVAVWAFIGLRNVCWSIWTMCWSIISKKQFNHSFRVCISSINIANFYHLITNWLHHQSSSLMSSSTQSFLNMSMPSLDTFSKMSSILSKALPSYNHQKLLQRCLHHHRKLHHRQGFHSWVGVAAMQVEGGSPPAEPRVLPPRPPPPSSHSGWSPPNPLTLSPPPTLSFSSLQSKV